MIFPITKSKYKIIRHVFEHDGVKISKLLKETSVSQRVGYKHIKKLSKTGIIKDQSKGTLRIIKPELRTETGKLIYGIIEKQKEAELTQRNKKIKQSLTHLKNSSNQLGIKSIILFGEFIKEPGEQKIDILLISDNNDKKVVTFLKECFNNVQNAVSARIMSEESFTKFRRNKKELFKQLFNNHICVYNTNFFSELIKS